MALNAIDGMLAREYNQQTADQALSSQTGDIISDAALYLLRFSPDVVPALVVLTVLLAWLTEFCGILHQALTGQRDYRGPLGKSDRAYSSARGPPRCVFPPVRITSTLLYCRCVAADPYLLQPLSERH